MYDTVLTEYKAILSLWHKGTGGGSGYVELFEGWNDDKCNKYDADPCLYDHTDI